MKISQELFHDMFAEVEAAERVDGCGRQNKYYEKWKFSTRASGVNSLVASYFLQVTSPHLHEQTAIFPWGIFI